MSDRALATAGDGASSVALAQIVGTGNVRAGLERVQENVRDVIDVCRARGFVQRFDGQREFFGLPAWQLLGMTYGLLPFVEWTRPLPTGDGWEARAVVRTVEGADIGAAEAMCTRAERNRGRSSDHDLRAMAQTRAQRNALRAVLGSALVLAGFDFADPDAPATRDQIKAIWTLAGRHGMSRDEAHERAGVASMLELSREQATELIDELSELPEAATPSERSPAAQRAEGAGEVAVDADPVTSPAQQPAHEGSPVGPVGAEGYGEGPEAPAGTISDPFARYLEALSNLPNQKLAPAITRRAIKAAGLSWPPLPDWPAEVLTSVAAILEGAAAHPAGADT